jgi:hypothetical protein
MGDKRDFKEDFQSIQSVHNNYGTITATGVTFEDGGVTFNGTSGLISYPAARVTPTNEGVFVTWVKLNAVGSTQYICTSAYESGLNNYLVLSVNASNQLEYIQRNNDTATTVKGGTALSINTWYRVAFSSDGTAISIYLNGVAESLTVVGSNNGDWLAQTLLRDNVVFGGLKRSSTIYDSLSLKKPKFLTKGWTAQEALDDYNGTTYSALDASKALIYIPGRTGFNDDVNEVTENLGTVGNLINSGVTFNPLKELVYNGSGNLETAGNVALAATDSFVFHCRFTTTGTTDYLLDWRVAAGAGGIGVFTDGTGRVTAYSAGLTSHTLVTSLSYNDGVERDMTVTWNNTDASDLVLTIYIDGELVASQTRNVPTGITRPIVIGDWRDKTLGWVGTTKDTGLWRTTGTPRQARWLYNRSLRDLNL